MTGRRRIQPLDRAMSQFRCSVRVGHGPGYQGRCQFRQIGSRSNPFGAAQVAATPFRAQAETVKIGIHRRAG
jgi:hypothetical protein